MAVEIEVQNEQIEIHAQEEQVSVEMKEINVTPTETKGNARIGEVTLLASAWVYEEDEKYSQVVNINGVTEKSQVDLTPTDEQLVIFHQKSLAFTTKNLGGVVTVYAIGDRPTNDYIIQVTIKEVLYE